MPEGACFVEREFPLAQMLLVSGKCQIEQLEFDRTGNFDEVPIAIHRHHEHGNSLVARVVAVVPARGQQRTELDLRDAGEEFDLLGDKGNLPGRLHLLPQVLRFAACDLQLLAETGQLFFILGDLVFVLPELRLQHVDVPPRVAPRANEGHQSRHPCPTENHHARGDALK